jgi:hypothetical protein
LLVLLLAANALVLAWTQGWLAPALQPPRHAEREPERLAAQVQPERVVVLAPGAASSAVAAARAAARACLETGPVAEAQLAAAEATLVQAGLAPGSWARGAPVAGQASGVWLRATQLDAETQARLRALQDPALPGPFRPCEPAR